MLNRNHLLGLFTTIATVSGVLLAAQAIAAEQWVKVLTNPQGVWFVDKSSIAKADKNRTFWSYIVYDKPIRHNKLAIYSEGSYVTVNCQSHRYSLRYKRLMDKDNQLVREIDLGRQGVQSGLPQKGSGEAASIDLACAQ